jgi:hypothetical protein
MFGEPVKITLVYGVANEERARELRDQIPRNQNIEVVSCSASAFATLSRLDGDTFQ